MSGKTITPGILLDPETHQYYVDGVSVPSVTQVLADCGMIDRQWFTDQATTRGTYVHEATALDDRDDLNWEELDAKLSPFCAAWRSFLRETGAEILAIEEQVAAAPYTYVGTLDRRIRWNGCEWVIDLKTGASLKWHALQLAAYAAACGHSPVKRATVYLRSGGRYAMTPHADPQDFGIWTACVALYHWKRKP